MFSGKGGVGKTTLSCGFARHWSQQFPGDRVLLISTDPAHSLGDVLQVAVDDTAHPLVDLPNLQVRALNAQSLLREFKAQYGKVLELLVERGSFVQGEDLSPVWDLSFPGLDELMAVLEIQRLLRDRIADRVVVDMAPSGHTLNLFKLMDFLDNFLGALDLFQEKHRVISQTFTGRYIEDEADQFLTEMKADLTSGRLLLQDAEQTACFVVAIAEPLSLLETTRFLDALQTLQIPLGGIWVNHLLEADSSQADETWSRYAQQQKLLEQFLDLAITHPVFGVPQQVKEPVGAIALDRLMQQASVVTGDALKHPTLNIAVEFPAKISPVFDDFIQAGRRLVLVGGKGGVGKTTVAAAIAWGMATQHGDRNVRVISIDPAHSLGDALGRSLGHNPQWLMPNLSAQEIDAEEVLTQFREEYLWELAEMMSGDNQEDTSLSIAYGPEAWRQIVSQSLPGIDEMLSLLTIMELLEKNEQDLIVLDTAPTGHLLRFLEMPTALGDWLAWIFKLWIKYQDVVGRTEFMGRLRTLRQRVMQAQKKLKDAQHTEFIGVMQAQSAILAEATRLTETLSDMGISQRYVVQNRFEAGQETVSDRFPHQTVVRLPVLPVAIAPQDQIKAAAQCLF
ncbi:ArsA family ATPase [Oscillatoria sp. FACHB-1407]|nr:ArsA family ATPase [Oscillatoria sp. FACHB-1407]